jgi:hypothetical protein
MVTFKTRAHASIPMLGDVAAKMLEMMGFGSNVPGAIVADDVPRALENLQKALSKIPEQAGSADDDEEDQPAIGMHTRAFPLLELLRAAVAEDELVSWE